MILNPDAAPLPGFGEAIRRPWLRGARLGRLAGAGRRRRRRRGSTPPATRSTSPASSGPAATAEPIADGAAGRRGHRRSPAPAWRSRCATWRRGRRLPGALLPLPRGRRPLAAAAAAPAARSGSSRRRSSTTTTSSAPASTSGAGSSATGSPSCPRLPGARCWSCWRRRCSPPSWRCSPVSIAGGWGRQKLRGEPRSPRAGCRACCASAAQVQATAHGQRRRVRLLADARPRLRPSSPPLARSLPARLALRGYWRAACALPARQCARSAGSVGRIRISLTSTLRRLLERVDHGAGDVVVAAAPTRRGGCRRTAVSTIPGSIRVTLIAVVLVHLAQLRPQRLADRRRRPLGRRVERARQRPPAGDRAGDQEVAVAALEQVGEGGADRQRHAVDVGQDHRAPVLGRLLEEAAAGAEAGVGEDGVDPAEALERRPRPSPRPGPTR